MAPFARASEADRNCTPGYLWPPHLYQETLSLEERHGKSERNIEWSPSKKVLQLEGLEWNVLGSDEEFAGERAFGRAAIQGFFGGKTDEIGIVVFLGDVRENKIARDGIEAVGVA